MFSLPHLREEEADVKVFHVPCTLLAIIGRLACKVDNEKITELRQTWMLESLPKSPPIVQPGTVLGEPSLFH